MRNLKPGKGLMLNVRKGRFVAMLKIGNVRIHSIGMARRAVLQRAFEMAEHF